MVSRQAPGRGDIVWLDFDPQTGREQAKTRPALVLSPRRYNRLTELALVCPITSQAKGYAFDVPLPAGLKTQGVVQADQVRSLDWLARRARRIESAPAAIVEMVTARAIALVTD